MAIGPQFAVVFRKKSLLVIVVSLFVGGHWCCLKKKPLSLRCFWMFLVHCFFRYFLELCPVNINTVPTVLRKNDTIQTQIHHATKQPCMHLILCSAVEDPHLNLGL